MLNELVSTTLQQGYNKRTHATRVLTFYFRLWLFQTHKILLFSSEKTNFLFIYLDVEPNPLSTHNNTPHTKAGWALNSVIAVNDRVEALQTVTDIGAVYTI